jgi:ABC-type dipeptide/oligopeptide/nickel transport system ATPase component
MLLSIRGLQVEFATDEGIVQAVRGVDLDIAEGEAVGLVGESGSGKSVTALSVLRLLPEPPARIAAGQILFEGSDLLTKSEEDMQRLRGDAVSMIFQEPMTSLNPVMPIGAQVAESLLLHRGEELGPPLRVADRALARVRVPTLRMGARRRAAGELAVRALAETGIPDPERVAGMYPHELSGGMRQRAMIAIAMACHPRLLIADEPTTALDVTIQAQILELMQELRQRHGSAVLLITHHLGVVAEFCDRVAVMLQGRIVEEAPVRELFRAPLHPYTRALLASVPDLDAPRARTAPPPAMVRDVDPTAPLREVAPGHRVALPREAAA